MSRLTADLLLLSAALLWGLAFYFQKEAMAHVGPMTFVMARGLIAALALLPFALGEPRDHTSRASGAQPEPPVAAQSLAGAALFAGLAFLAGAGLQQAGLMTATVTNAGFLTALYVVFTPFVAWALLRRRPGSSVWPAIALSFLGTWALGGGGAGKLSGGDLLVGTSALFWALHVVATSRASALGRPFSFTALQFFIVGVGAAPFAFAVEAPSAAALWEAALPVAYVGLISSALTFSILVIALRHTAPSEAAVLLSTESLFAALAGAVLAGDRLPPVAWAGAALIMGAVLVVQLGGRRARGSPGATSG